MWSLRELTAGLKELFFHEVRNWLNVAAYVIIWTISFVLIGSIIEIALGEKFQ